MLPRNALKLIPAEARITIGKFEIPTGIEPKVFNEKRLMKICTNAPLINGGSKKFQRINCKTKMPSPRVRSRFLNSNINYNVTCFLSPNYVFISFGYIFQ